VNFFVGCVGATQVTRIFLYRRSVRSSTEANPKEVTAEEAKDVGAKPESVAKTT
jgi:hypothetical protein